MSTTVKHYKAVEGKFPMGMIVQAIALDASNAGEIAHWCEGLEVEEIHPIDKTRWAAVNVPTPNGRKRASLGDVVVKGPMGHFMVMKPGQFEEYFSAED